MDVICDNMVARKSKSLMYSLKRELKLNNKEVSLMRGCSGFKRWVYNWALKLIKASWEFEDIKASDTKRLDAAKKVFTNQVMQYPEYAWMKEYPSTIYQSAFQDLKEAFSRACSPSRNQILRSLQ